MQGGGEWHGGVGQVGTGGGRTAIGLWGPGRIGYLRGMSTLLTRRVTGGVAGC